MTDLVAELRAESPYQWHNDELHCRAADEIERLRAELNGAKEKISRWQDKFCVMEAERDHLSKVVDDTRAVSADVVRQLEAERDRLRAALERAKKQALWLGHPAEESIEKIIAICDEELNYEK